MTLTTEQKRGSDCNGIDGATNRVLTLANTALTDNAFFQVFVNGLALVSTTEFTPAHLNSSSTVTFLNPVWNTDYIIVFYNQSGAVPTVGVYTSSTNVYLKSGLSVTDIANDSVNALILDAEAELEMLTGRKFTNANSVTEYISIGGENAIGTKKTRFRTQFYPIQSVSLCELIDMDGGVTLPMDPLTNVQISAGTIDTEDYWIEMQRDSIMNSMLPNGSFILKVATIPKGINIVKITYTYGYGATPHVIGNLATTMSAVRAWVTFLGGSYGGINSYSIPEQSVNKGDLYTRGMQNISVLTEEANRLLDRVGRKARSLAFMTGGDI